MCVVSCLTGGAVLVSAVDENSVQLGETGPALHSAVETFQVVQVSGWTGTQKQTQSSPQRRVWFCATLTGLQNPHSPRVRVAEVRPEF